MIDVDHHHLRGAARRAARLDRAGRPVADLQEAHQARRFAAAAQRLVLAADRREVRAGARAVFEQARLADPQIHDAAVVDQIVGDALDEAGVRLRVLVGRGRAGQFAALVIDVEMALARAVDAVGPVQAGVEPLRRVGGGHLHGQHEAHLVVEGAGVGLGLEIAALPAPIGPGAGQTVEDLLGRGFAGFGRGALGRDLAPQPRGDGVLLDRLQFARHALAAEIFLGEHVARHLAPGGRNLDVLLAEDDRAVGIADFAGRLAEGDPLIGVGLALGEVAFDAHKPESPLVFSDRCSAGRAHALRTSPKPLNFKKSPPPTPRPPLPLPPI